MVALAIGPPMSDNYSRFDVLVAAVIALLIFAWVIAFVGFWIWGTLT